MNKIYEKSGKWGSMVLFGSIAGICIIPLLSFVYGKFSSQFSMSFFDTGVKFLLFVVFAFVLCILQLGTINLSKCRNNRVKGIFLIVTTIVAYYFSWLFFVMGKLNGVINFDLIATLFFNPSNLFSSVKEIFFRSPGWNTFFWISELIGFALVPVISYVGLKEVVFCEDCNTWTEDINFKLHLMYESREQLQEIAERDVQKLLNLPIAENLSENHIVLNFQACDSCLNTNTVNIDLVTFTSNNGTLTRAQEDYGSIILISSTLLESFKSKLPEIGKTTIPNTDEPDQKTTMNKIYENSGTSELEAFKNKAEEAKKFINNQEEVEYVRTSLIERFFYSRSWKWSLVITAILLSATYIIEPFLEVDSKVEVCESIELITQVTEDDLAGDFVDVFYEIKLVRKNNEISPKSLRMPSSIGESIHKGDTITSIRTKWRKEHLEIKLKDGLVFPTKDPYAIFIVAPLILIFVSYVLLLPANNPPKTNEERKGQKVHRYYYLIVNFLCSSAVIFLLYLSVNSFMALA